MRILIDECLPRKLKFELSGHEVFTVPEAGWQGMKNGELLRQAQLSFDVFLTIDRGIAFQQNLTILKIAVISPSASDNRFETLRPLMRKVLAALPDIEPGTNIRISG